jgi:hypothetical protein
MVRVVSGDTTSTPTPTRAGCSRARSTASCSSTNCWTSGTPRPRRSTMNRDPLSLLIYLVLLIVVIVVLFKLLAYL